MAIIIAAAALLLLFFVVRKHNGVMHLAMTAGLSIYALLGETFAGWLQNVFHDADFELLKMIIYVILVVGFPMLLFFKSSRGGLTGLLHVAETILTTAIVITFIAEPLAYFFSFDALSVQILDFIKTIEGQMITVGVITAYLDILLTHRL